MFEIPQWANNAHERKQAIDKAKRQKIQAYFYGSLSLIGLSLLMVFVGFVEGL